MSFCYAESFALGTGTALHLPFWHPKPHTAEQDNPFPPPLITVVPDEPQYTIKPFWPPGLNTSQNPLSMELLSSPSSPDLCISVHISRVYQIKFLKLDNSSVLCLVNVTAGLNERGYLKCTGQVEGGGLFSADEQQ